MAVVVSGEADGRCRNVPDGLRGVLCLVRLPSVRQIAGQQDELRRRVHFGEALADAVAVTLVTVDVAGRGDPQGARRRSVRAWFGHATDLPAGRVVMPRDGY